MTNLVKSWTVKDVLMPFFWSRVFILIGCILLPQAGRQTLILYWWYSSMFISGRVLMAGLVG